MSRIRVGILSDFAEEAWPSMDVVAEALLRELGAGGDVHAVELRPQYRRLGSAPGHRLRSAERLYNRQWVYWRHVRGVHAQCDVFHVVDHSYAHLVHALPPHRTVVTCHDLVAFRSILEPELEPRSAAFRLMTRRIFDGLRTAALVVCDAATVRDELHARGVVPASRSLVVPLGVSAEFSAAPHAVADAAVQALLGPRTDAVELLHVGGNAPRKRIDLFLETCALLQRARRVRVIRVGGPLTDAQRAQAQAHGLELVELPFLDRSVLAALYRRASLLLQPSDAEGFGLPPIEALACGTPVLASDLEVLREVGGDAVSFAPPGSAAAFAAAADAILDESPSAREARRSRGLLHAAAYSWSAYAARMADVYRGLAGA